MSRSGSRSKLSSGKAQKKVKGSKSSELEVSWSSSYHRNQLDSSECRPETPVLSYVYALHAHTQEDEGPAEIDVPQLEWMILSEEATKELAELEVEEVATWVSHSSF